LGFSLIFLNVDVYNLLENSDLTGIKIPKLTILIMKLRYLYKKQIKIDYKTQLLTDRLNVEDKLKKIKNRTQKIT
jgi:hypothetical protein